MHGDDVDFDVLPMLTTCCPALEWPDRRSWGGVQLLRSYDVVDVVEVEGTRLRHNDVADDIGVEENSKPRALSWKNTEIPFLLPQFMVSESRSASVDCSVSEHQVAQGVVGLLVTSAHAVQVVDVVQGIDVLAGVGKPRCTQCRWTA